MYEEIDLQPSPFRVSGPPVRFLVQDWSCCNGERTWPIVIAVGTWDSKLEVWRTEAQHVRKCGYCGNYPVRPS